MEWQHSKIDLTSCNISALSYLPHCVSSRGNPSALMLQLAMICFLFFFLARGIVHSKQIEQQLTKLSKLRLALSSWWKSSREKTQGHLFGKFKELLGNLGLSTRMSVLGGRPPWQHFGSILGEAAPKKGPKLRQAGLQPSTPPQQTSKHKVGIA